MTPFTYNALPTRVIFGFGTLERVGEEIAQLDAGPALILSTSAQGADAQALAMLLGGQAAGIFTGAAMHTPVDVTERALAAFRETGAGCTVALGGGSTTGLGKALALRTGCPQIVVPTTYAGSEATPILGETKDGLKTTLKSPKVLPKVVIYDVDLTLSLPVGLSATSGLNAMAHAVEALYAQDATPVISLLAEEGLRALAHALPHIRANPANREARSDALYGAWLCGTCLGAVGMALHHKLCHVLGGSFDLPHAETHAVILPYAVAYNAKAAPDAMVRLSRALGTQDPARGLFDLGRRLGIPASLAEIGMSEDGIAKAAKLATANPYWNPRSVEEEPIRSLLTAAFHGEEP